VSGLLRCCVLTQVFIDRQEIAGKLRNYLSTCVSQEFELFFCRFFFSSPSFSFFLSWLGKTEIVIKEWDALYFGKFQASNA